MKALGSIARSRRHLIGLAFLVLFLGVAVTLLDWRQVLNSVQDLSAGVLLVALGCIVATQFISASRFYVLIRPFAQDLKWLRALQANMAGHLGSLVLIQVVGQMAGRQSILAAHGLRPATLALTTLTERALVAGVGLAGFVGGVVTVFSKDILADIVRQVQILPLLGTALVAALVSFFVAGTRIEKALAARVMALRTGMVLVGSALLSVLGWATMLAAFVVILGAVAPEVDLVDAIAASAIVSFAAALPVSINGWGVRELAAIWAFGQLGVSPADATVASVTVGLLSTLAILGLSPMLLLRRQDQPTPDVETASGGRKRFDGPPSTFGTARRLADVAGAWLLGLGASVLIFFQFHTEFQGTLININLADPMALLAITVVALHAVTDRRVPALRVRWILPALALCTAVIVFSFARGVLDFGVTSWALNNRLLGWFILMGYVSAGAYLVAVGGRAGQRRLVETLLFTVAVVVLLETALRTLAVSELIRLNTSAIFQGFSANRNAYAFAGLITLALAIPLLQVQGRRRLYVWAVRIAIGFAIFGVWASQSRTGIGTLGVVLIYLMVTSERTRRATIHGLGVAIGIGLFMVIFPNLVELLRMLWPYVLDAAAWVSGAFHWLWSILLWVLNGMPDGAGGSSGMPAFSASRPLWGGGDESRRLLMIWDMSAPQATQDYDSFRWRGIVLGFNQWLDHPWIGGGLGSFMQNYPDMHEAARMIHNTTVWLLAESGLVGASIFLLTFGGLVHLSLRQGLAPQDEWRQSLFICLAIFGAFSLVHEVAYQRIFWLALGIVMASYSVRGRAAEDHAANQQRAGASSLS